MVPTYVVHIKLAIIDNYKILLHIRTYEETIVLHRYYHAIFRIFISLLNNEMFLPSKFAISVFLIVLPIFVFRVFSYSVIFLNKH